MVAVVVVVVSATDSDRVHAVVVVLTVVETGDSHRCWLVAVSRQRGGKVEFGAVLTATACTS